MMTLVNTSIFCNSDSTDYATEFITFDKKRYGLQSIHYH
jgi:hypothetical protein